MNDNGGTARWVKTLIAVQIAIPAVLLIVRLATGARPLYGLSWSMFSG